MTRRPRRMYTESVSERKVAIGILRARPSTEPPSSAVPASGASRAVTEIVPPSGVVPTQPTPSVVEAGFVTLFDATLGPNAHENEAVLRSVSGVLESLRDRMRTPEDDEPPPSERSIRFRAAFLLLYDALVAVDEEAELALSEPSRELLSEARQNSELDVPQAVARLQAFAARTDR